MRLGDRATSFPLFRKLFQLPWLFRGEISHFLLNRHAIRD
jgi:hypothetical protein